MELPDLGKRCSNSFCKQLDFIPLKCLCQCFFCKDHFTEHCLSGACEYYSKFKNEPNFTESSQVYKCSSEKCFTSSYIRLPCPKCLKHYCIEHRFHPECPEIDPEVLKVEKERWEQPRSKFNKAKAHVEAEVTRKLRISQQSSSTAKTALKIQLMKLKSKAKGETTIPVIDRIYFAITKPSSSIAKKLEHSPSEETEKNFNINVNSSFAVFVSKNWSLGRVIDSISNIFNVKNENNKSNVPKLRLFRELDGLCVDISKMDTKLSELLSKEILLNGDRVILEYISFEELSTNDDQVYFLVK